MPTVAESKTRRASRADSIGLNGHSHGDETVERSFVGDHSSNGGRIGEAGTLRLIGPRHGWLGLPHRALRMNPRTRVDSLMADRATEPSRDRGVKMLGIHPVSSGGRGGAPTRWYQRDGAEDSRENGGSRTFSRVALHDVRLPTDRRSITSASAAAPTVTATAATVAATAATTTATAAAATAVAATAATAIFTGLGFVDGQASAIMLRS